MVAAWALGAFTFAAAAFAVPAGSVTMLGVDEQTAVALGPEVSAEAKFTDIAEDGPQAHRRLLATATKKSAKRIAKATRPTERDATPRVEKSRPVAKKSKTSTGGWKRAKVSWYGPGLYGNGMAGGGTLKKDSMVLAHRTLAFGTKVKVSYQGRTVTAVVQDRGPYVSGRTFDLGPGTAKSLGFSGVGTIKYRIVK